MSDALDDYERSTRYGRAVLMVYAEIAGDARGGELGPHTDLRTQLAFLLADLRHLAEEELHICWGDLLHESTDDYAGDLIRRWEETTGDAAGEGGD